MIKLFAIAILNLGVFISLLGYDAQANFIAIESVFMLLLGMENNKQ